MRAIVGLVLSLLSSAVLAQDEVPATKPIVPNNRWALVVGVAGYSPAVGPLGYSANDAHSFAGALTGDLGFEPDRVRLLADKGQSDVAPTSANILAALDAILKDPRLDRANLFVFYFSGHGVATPNGDFLLPADAVPGRFEEMGVPVREVIARIVGAGLKNVLFVTDACRSGTANDFGADLTDLCHRANLAVILGCAPGLRSYEDDTFEQGTFTHYLLEAIRRPELRDASGVLWASKMGTDVQERVRERTARRYKPAQVPTLWAERTTLDVLLAAYPQPPVSDETVKSFRTNATRLTRKDYAAAMIAYANRLDEAERTDATVEMLKAVDALGELTPEARYTLATSLNTLGRTGEAERVFTGFDALPPGFWRDLGQTSSTARNLDPAQRLKAALSLFETTDEPIYKVAAYAVVAQYGNSEGKLALAKRLAGKATTSRVRLYAASQVALYEGRWEDSLRAIEAARAAPGDTPNSLVLYYAKLEPLKALGDEGRLQAYYDEGLTIRGVAAFAWTLKASLAKDQGDAKGRVEALRTALKNDPTPDAIFVITKLAGPYVGMLKEEIKAAAQKHPYAWRARLALLVVNHITHDAGEKEDLLASDRYADDPLTIYAAWFDYMEGFMAEAAELGRLKPDVYRSQTDYYFLVLKDHIARFGYDADLWLQIVRYGMFNERGAQVEALVRDHLKFSPEAAPKDLKPALVLLAMNRGDEAGVRHLYQKGFEATERTDPQWIAACYDAMLGRTKEAMRQTANLAPPSPELRGRAEALKTYLLAASGKAEEARGRLGKASGDTIVRALHGLAWAAVGDWKRAEPLLAESIADRDWSFLFVQQAALRRLDARYRATGRLAGSRDLAFNASISEPGNPSFNAFTYLASPSVAAFAGSAAMEGGTLDDKDPNVTGHIVFTVTPNGTFTGSLKPLSGETLRMRGRVDAYGNVRGTGAWHGKLYALTAKIAPSSLYGRYPKFHTTGQVFQLVGPDATRIVVIGRTKT